jgi:hypothetical protein
MCRYATGTHIGLASVDKWSEINDDGVLGSLTAPEWSRKSRPPSGKAVLDFLEPSPHLHGSQSVYLKEVFGDDGGLLADLSVFQLPRS